MKRGKKTRFFLPSIGVLMLSFAAGCAFDAEREHTAALSELVQSCEEQAQSGHATIGARGLVSRADIAAHKEQMAAVCREWLTADRASAGDLLARCESEAAGGPPNLRQIVYDQQHVTRMQAICRKLDEAVSAKSAEHAR